MSRRLSLSRNASKSTPSSLRSSKSTDRIIASIEVEAAGVMEVEAPWTNSDLDNIRYERDTVKYPDPPAVPDAGSTFALSLSPCRAVNPASGSAAAST